MKRFITVLSGILVLPAFAEVAPIYYDEIVEYTDEMLAAEDAADVAEKEAVQQKNVAQRNTINRSTSASRAISSASNTTRANTSSRAVAASPRSATGTSRGTTARTARASNVVSRSASTASRASVTPRSAQATKPVTARVSASVNSAPVMRTNTRTNQTAYLTEGSDAPLYKSNSSRISIANSRLSSSVGSRLATSVATTPVVTEEDVSSTTSNLTAIAELTDYCKAQYAACMDNYCNVLDDNQGRCSCSKNLKNYSKTEDALATATEQFQEAVQKIRYIGLTGAQIEALFAETEAELAMKSNSDTSQLKTSLDAIKRKVIDASSPTSSSYDATSGLSLDLNGLLNADFTAGFDLNSFLGTGTTTNTTSVSNQRGEQLYKTATNRCKTAVLNSCTAQGIEANVITNSYDLEIDKQCIAYERALNEANTEMKNNVINATNILQQARLLLTQNKNSYDLRGCVAAIDSCMQDDYVCGSDYEFCLDPTGKYLANGEIVKGGTPGISGGQVKTTTTLTDSNLDSWTSGGMYDLYATWNYGSGLNAWGAGKDENLGGYIDEALTTWERTASSSKDTTITGNLALYLLQKVGYIDTKDDDKVHGMCASVMKQCQAYTFNNQKSSKEYIPDNEVVRQYLNNTLAKIKVQQDSILATHAEGCSADVKSCLTSNGYDETRKKSVASTTAINACATEIVTCMSVTGYKPTTGTELKLTEMQDWVSNITATDSDDTSSDSGSSSSSSSSSSGTTTSCPDGYYRYGSQCFEKLNTNEYATPDSITQVDATHYSIGFSYGTVTWEATCSSNAGTADQTGTPVGTGNYCWCRATNFTPVNGTSQTWNNSWVYDEMLNNCSSECLTTGCSGRFGGVNTFRKAAYGSYAQ